MRIIKDYALITEELTNRINVLFENAYYDGKILKEMRDTPDNSLPAMTRQQVEQLLWNFERRENITSYNLDEAHSRFGMKRVMWWPQNVTGDYEPILTTDNTDNTKAAMGSPWEMYFDAGDSRLSEITNGMPDGVSLNDIVYSYLSDYPDIDDEIEYIINDGNSVHFDKGTLTKLRDHNLITKLFSDRINTIEDVQTLLNQAFPDSMDDPSKYAADELTKKLYNDHKGYSKLVNDDKGASDYLNTLKESKIDELMESQKYRQVKPNRHRRDYGRIAVVDRIRNGKTQIRKKVSNVKGYRIVNGRLVRMTISEILKRKRGARIASRKRAVEMAAILRHRKVSLRRRNIRFGV